MAKVVINNCFGGFRLSDDALKYFSILKQETVEYAWKINRDDVDLIKVVEELGEEAFGESAQLIIKEVDDQYNWTISEYDGLENIVLKPKEETVRHLCVDPDKLIAYLNGCNAFG